ncbi:hypothetical protein LTR10_009928 [Elasticomyces elasticus]|nr:hypothetical protein LTR10_009928 [Elasticomyces elasticus]KAK4970218.1 hypothetical protein LTR42_008385 [Elasticomyces elasticus]
MQLSYTFAIAWLAISATARVVWIPETFDPSERSIVHASSTKRTDDESQSSWIPEQFDPNDKTTIIASSITLRSDDDEQSSWIPEQFDPSDKDTIVASSITIRADESLQSSCGPAFPSDFTCPPSTQCLALNSSSSVKSVICCPAGQDCRFVQAVSCNRELQNATLYQSSSLHSEPTVQLETCASDCCPMGYSCQNGQCAAPSAPIPATSVTVTVPSSTTTSASSSSTTSSSTPPTSTSSASSTPTIPAGLTSGSDPTASHSSFSGSSFAAGFFPGIVLGALLTCLVFWLLARRSRSRDSYIDGKQSPHDTLTDLHTLSRRPTLHGRSISEPITHPDADHRTEFLRNTPPRLPEMGYSVAVHATQPQTPARTPKAVKALFSRSPFLNQQTPASPADTQPPLPAHLKRGTLSFSVSPVRALKKQKSMHSLRRQMTDTSRSGNWRTRPEASRSGSQETIQVLMPSHEQPFTPDQRLQPKTEAPATLDSTVYQPHDSTASWRTTDSAQQQPAQPQYASSSRYPTQTFTPTRVPVGGNDDASLGTPYTPSRYYGSGKVKDVLIGSDGALRVVREPEKRDTTFSAMMERAGFRRSELLVGHGVQTRR